MKYLGEKFSPKKVKKWINSHDDKYDTPLHYAARNCDTEMMKELYKLKVKPDEKGNNQMTPLHNAARYGKVRTSSDTNKVNFLLRNW